MIEFTIIYKTGKKEKVKAENRDAMIKNFSSTDATALQEQVKEIHWTIDDFHHIEDLATGKIQEIEITEGDKDF